MTFLPLCRPGSLQDRSLVPSSALKSHVCETGTTVGLAHGHEFHIAYIHVCRAVHDPPHRTGDIFRFQGLALGVFLVGLHLIPCVVHQGKFRARAAGGDAGHPHGRPQKVGTHVVGKMAHKGLACAVDVACGKSPVPRHGPHIDHMPPAPGAKWDDDLSDRYIYFASRILELASRYRGDVIAASYAYGVYKNAPRREKVHPQLVLGFVPSMFEPEQTEKNYKAWAEAGARKLFLRPNDHHAISIGLPTGGEKQLFKAFRLGVKYNIIGSDYDSSHNFWPAVGIADYILARAHIHPEETFEQHESEYYAGFGSAAAEVGEYYRYWRCNIWEKRIYPNRKEIAKLGLYGNYQRGLMWNLNRYYRLSDFDATDAILARAAAKELSAQDRKRVEMLQLANRYFRLFFQACTAKQEEKQKVAAQLLDFRCRHHRDLMFDWNRMATLEGRYGDVAGVAKASLFREFSGYRSLPLKWFFRPDPDNVGVKEKWETFSAGRIQAQWEPILTNAGWERQKNSSMHPKLQKFLENYDGYGYYGLELKIPAEWKGREIEIYFGAVDESAWIYLNGKKTGERIFRKGSEDWKTPFRIPITSVIDWDKPAQTLVVRVHDSGGQGGIWQPCYLICR